MEDLKTYIEERIKECEEDLKQAEQFGTKEFILGQIHVYKEILKHISVRLSVPNG